VAEERQVRAAHNEALARDVNEIVEDVAADWFEPDERLEFRCECGDAECAAHVALTPAEYDSVRADPLRFVIVAGHENLTAERVVGRIGEYLLVAKTGLGVDVARETDPRSDG
jgi:hypothetical protein